MNACDSSFFYSLLCLYSDHACMGRLLRPACCPPSCEPGCSSLGAFKNAGIYAPFFGALCTAAFLTERERPCGKNILRRGRDRISLARREWQTDLNDYLNYTNKYSKFAVFIIADRCLKNN